MTERLWLLVLDLVFWVGRDQGSQIYLWVLSKASDAAYRVCPDAPPAVAGDFDWLRGAL